jgi:hypothetical protein
MHLPRLLAAVLSTLMLFNAPVAAGDDVVTRWNRAALDAIRAERTPPPVASRALAILHTSIFDAMNGIAAGYEPYLVPIRPSLSGSLEAAASAAAYKALVVLFPAEAAAFDAVHAETLKTIPDGSEKWQGLAWGGAVAEKILFRRSFDRSTETADPPSQEGPGAWIPTPPGFLSYLLPQWGDVRPFALRHGDDFRPPGPPALESATYAHDYNEVKALGAAVGSTRTDEQTLIALFWADGAGTETPPGHWNTIARQVSDQLETPLLERARLFALLNVALADAAICAWDAKYAFAFWRPVTAIRNGDLDGNDETDPDPGWSSFIVTPPFPDYVSGHSTFSGAAATVLALFYGSDDIAFTATSDFLPGVTRTFSSLSEAAAEAAISRMYGGIHFRSANEDGLRAGAQIGAWVAANVMQAGAQLKRARRP